MSAEEFVREKLRRYAQLRGRMDLASVDILSPSFEAQQKKLIDLTKYYEETTMMMNNLHSPKNMGDGSGNSTHAQTNDANDADDQRDDSAIVQGTKIPVVNEEKRHEELRRDGKPFDFEFREVTREQASSSASLGGTSESGKSKYEQALDRLAQIRHRATRTKTPSATTTTMKVISGTSDTSTPVTSLLARKPREPNGSFLLGEHNASKHERLVQKSIVSRKTALAPSGDTLSLPPLASTKSSTGSVKSSLSEIIRLDDKVVSDDPPSQPVNHARLFIDTFIVSKDLEKANAESRKVSKDFMSAFSYEFKKKPDPEEQSDIIYIDDILDDKQDGRERILMRTSSSDENPNTGKALFEDVMPISIKLRRKTNSREQEEQINRATAPIIVQEEYDDGGGLLLAASVRFDRTRTPMTSKSFVVVNEGRHPPETVDAEADYLAIQRNKQSIKKPNKQEYVKNKMKKNDIDKQGESFQNSIEGTIVDAEYDYRKIQERAPQYIKEPPLIGRLKTSDLMSRSVHFHEIDNNEEAMLHVKNSSSATKDQNQVFHSVYNVCDPDNNHTTSKKQMYVVEEMSMDPKALSPMSQLHHRLTAKHSMTMRKGGKDLKKINPEQTVLDSPPPSTSEQKKDVDNLSSTSMHLADRKIKHPESGSKKVTSSSSLLSKATTLNSAKRTGRECTHGSKLSIDGAEEQEDLNKELVLDHTRACSSSFHEYSAPCEQTTAHCESAKIKHESDSIEVKVSSDKIIPDKHPSTQSTEKIDNNWKDATKADDPDIDDIKNNDRKDSMSYSLVASEVSPSSCSHAINPNLSSFQNIIVLPKSVPSDLKQDDHLDTQSLHHVGMNTVHSPRRNHIPPERSPASTSERSVPERVQKLKNEDDTSALEIVTETDEFPPKKPCFTPFQRSSSSNPNHDKSHEGERENQHTDVFLEVCEQTLVVSRNGMVESFLHKECDEVDKITKSRNQSSVADKEQHNELPDCNEKGTSAGNAFEGANEQGEEHAEESQTSQYLVQVNSSEKIVKKIKNDIEISTSEDNSTDTERTEDKMFAVCTESLASDMDTAESDRYDACAFPFALRIIDSTCAWLESDELCKSKSLLRKVKKRPRRQLRVRNTNGITPKSVYVTNRLRSLDNAHHKTNILQRNFATEAHDLSPGSQSSKTPTMSNISRRSFTNNLLRYGRKATNNESKPKDPQVHSSSMSPVQPDTETPTSSPIELHVAKKGHAGMKALEGLSKASTDSSEENLKLDSSMELKIKEFPSPREKDIRKEDPDGFHEENDSSSHHGNNHQNSSVFTSLIFTRDLAGGPEVIQTSDMSKRNVSDTAVDNGQDPPNQDLFDSDSTDLSASASDSSGLSSLEVQHRIAAVDLADKLRRRAATLKRRRKIREKQRQLRANQSDGMRHNILATSI